MSLSVQRANYAVKLYREAGFSAVHETEEEWIMVCQLSGAVSEDDGYFCPDKEKFSKYRNIQSKGAHPQKT